MEITPGEGTCILDQTGTIIWANSVFIDYFSHRSPVLGSTFTELFPGPDLLCRPGAVFEDRDKLGRRRHFKAECFSTNNIRGEKIGDIVVLQNVTLMRTLVEISKYSTQTKTTKEFFEKVLWLIKDTYAYMGIAGFVARGDELEVVSSKGWTEKLKSMIGVQPIAPDSLGMAGRSAYHRKQMVTTIQDYAYLPTAKKAIERIGGEFIVVTPLLDHDKLVGTLTVFHNRELLADDLEVLQTLCNQVAVSLNVRLKEDELATAADEAGLYADIIGLKTLDNNMMISKYLEMTGTASMDVSRGYIREALRIVKRNNEMIENIKDIMSQAEGAKKISLDEAIRKAIPEAEDFAISVNKKVSFKITPHEDLKVMVSPLFKEAIYNVLNNSIKHSKLPSVDIDIRILKDRTGTRRLEIADNGPGIPDELKSEVFRRGKDSLRNKGAGIGLYLVKRIVNKEGGRIWIEDRIPGNPSRGARAVITFMAGPVKG
ncbi:histidine kinase [Methanocella sp. CWC-04]|uniref:Histidine kinase n=1 Tax=Methanooceanicella nereidis TaxID=2052831 RepID=A0AAP2W621_9EURY|nr:ATP-binding protein [Methanocella sp. CWC-04]MCD1293651.1 histidine kinase [Methanocella sp. CWC-04]